MSNDAEQSGGLGWMRRGRLREEDAGPRATEQDPRASVGRSKSNRRKKTGKRSNPDWELISAYMRKGTYRRVRQALLDQDPKMDFSDLIEGLCAEWLEEAGDGRESSDGS